MPRYFFDLHNDLDVRDEEGCELPDFEAAKDHAQHEARKMVEANVDDVGRVDLRHHIAVRDESGATVYTLHFEDAVDFIRDGRPV
jgi:hypothetical protein